MKEASQLWRWPGGRNRGAYSAARLPLHRNGGLRLRLIRPRGFCGSCASAWSGKVATGFPKRSCSKKA